MTLLEPIIQLVVEFIVVQTVRRGPKVVRKVWQQVKIARPRLLFVQRTKLVNREREIRTIRTALKEAPHLRIVYLSGPGGVGKTRLLEEVAHLTRAVRATTPLFWGGILDLYHADLHSVSALQKALIAHLDPEENYFQRYRVVRERFERRRAEGLTGSVLDQERKRLDEAFLQDYNAFAAEYRPVVAFDTLETLSYESDLIQNLCQLQDISVAAHDWLLQQVGCFNNSVFLLAGRPQPILRRNLEEAHLSEPGRLEVIELSGLTREDNRQLLKLFLKNAPQSAHVLRDHADRLWQLTSGLPVRLALTTELVAQSDRFDPAIINESDDVAAWGRRLVNVLFHYDDPASRVIFFLALARKGLTADLLHYLEPGWSRVDCEQRLAVVRTLGVVKTRSGAEELFLHDALYELFDAYSLPQAHLLPWYNRLADFYRARQAQVGSDRVAWGQATVNLLYYELQRDPCLAFEAGYVRWSELAIKGHEAGLDMQLYDELLRFCRFQPTQRATQALNQATIDRDSAVRWVKRLLARARHQRAVVVAETILALGPAPYPSMVPDPMTRLANLPAEQVTEARALFNPADSLFWGYLLTYYGEALVYTGAAEVQARHALDQAIALMVKVSLSHTASLVWLRERVLGRAYNSLGYLLRTHGHYADALESYRRALPHFEAAGITDEQANTLNNLAFLLALLGEVEQAKIYADQALTLYQGLGQRYPQALSHNTRGIIYALQGQVEGGQRECQLALNIFQELEAPRGIGLACNALGFILRQQGKTWKVGQLGLEQATSLFQQAARYLEQAGHIFSQQVSEPVRLWEAHNEQGSLYYNWGELLRQQGNEVAARQKYDQAVHHHLQALEIARRYGLRLQEADTCDDLAQVSASQGDMEKAQQWLEQGLSLVPREYNW